MITVWIQPLVVIASSNIPNESLPIRLSTLRTSTLKCALGPLALHPLTVLRYLTCGKGAPMLTLKILPTMLPTRFLATVRTLLGAVKSTLALTRANLGR